MTLGSCPRIGARYIVIELITISVIAACNVRRLIAHEVSTQRRLFTLTLPHAVVVQRRNVLISHPKVYATDSYQY